MDWFHLHKAQTKWSSLNKSNDVLIKYMYITLFKLSLQNAHKWKQHTNEKLIQFTWSSACWWASMPPRGRAFLTPILTIPFGAPFRAFTASSRLAFSSISSLTKMSRSPGSRRPSTWATPPGTKLLITITVLLRFSGSWRRIFQNINELSLLFCNWHSCLH